MRKKSLFIIANVIAIIGIVTSGVKANMSETPKTEYIRNGVTYQMYSKPLKELDPSFYEHLKKISDKIFGETPMIYSFNMPTLKTLLGFEYEFEDKSKAIYLGQYQTYKQAVQVYVHEMVHYSYDVKDNLFYSKNKWNTYKYPITMELLTDEIAKRLYEKYVTTEVAYKKAYNNKRFEELGEEQKQYLIECYTGTMNTELNEGFLEELEKYFNGWAGNITFPVFYVKIGEKIK